MAKKQMKKECSSIPKWIFDELVRNAEVEYNKAMDDVRQRFKRNEADPLKEMINNKKVNMLVPNVNTLKVSDLFDISVDAYSGWGENLGNISTRVNIGSGLQMKVERILNQKAKNIKKKYEKALKDIKKQYDDWRHTLLFGEISREDVKPFMPKVKI